MAQDNSDSHKLVKSVVLSDLEVCGLEENTYIQLPNTQSHTSKERKYTTTRRHCTMAVSERSTPATY